jgi:hypothetical protein
VVEAVGAAEVEALRCEGAAIELLDGVSPFAVSAVAIIAELVAVVERGSVMFTSLAATDAEVGVR